MLQVRGLIASVLKFDLVLKKLPFPILFVLFCFCHRVKDIKIIINAKNIALTFLVEFTTYLESDFTSYCTP